MQKVSDNIYILISIGIAGTLFLSAGIVYFFTLYLRRTALQKAAMHKKEIEYQARLFTVVIQSQQEEQRKIGREIHDEVSSLLSSIKLRMSAASMESVSNPVFAESIASIDKLSNIIRNVAHLLSPPEIELSGFHDALDTLCHNLSNNMIRINIQDDIPGFIPRDNFQLSISLYRIIQELITNTIKHAEASEIDIVIKNEGNTFILEYSDNGKGFDAEKIQMHGLGTQNIQSRLLMINASHIIDTAEGKGFRFIIYLEHPYII